MKDTNMLAASQLPLRHQMVVFSVQIELDEADSDNRGRLTQADTVAEGIIAWNNVVMNTYFTLQIENVKPYVEGPITRFPYGGGLYLVQSEQPSITISPTPLRTTTSAYQMQNGVPGAHGARRLAQPIHLGALETFQGIFKWPRGALPASTGATAISPTFDIGLTCYLVGPRQRPIG